MWLLPGSYQAGRNRSTKRCKEKMKTAITGGGIGGLALANAFENLNIDYHLYERAKAFTEKGAGIGISESTIEIFDMLGLKNRLLEEGEKVRFS